MAAGLTIDFDETHFQHHLLLLHYLHGVDDAVRIRHELPRQLTALSSVVASGAVPDSMMRPLIDDTLMRPLVNSAISAPTAKCRSPLQFENADRPLVGIIDRDTRGAAFLPKMDNL